MTQPCVFNKNGADEEFCKGVSKILPRNLDGCYATKCASRWRYCLSCVKHGNGLSPVAKDQVHSGLCTFHRDSGPNARREAPPKPTPFAPRKKGEDLTDVFRWKGGDTPTPAGKGNGKACKVADEKKPPHVQVPNPPPPTPREAAKAHTPKTPPAPVPPKKGARGAPVQYTEDGPWKEMLARAQRALANADYVKEVDPRVIRQMPGQPRTVFNPERIRRLSESLRESGQIQAITLRRIPEDAQGHLYELVDGERRWRAALEPGYEPLPLRAMVIDIDDEGARYVISVVANFNREAATVLDTCDSITKMHEVLKIPMESIAKMYGNSLLWVNQYYGLRRLVPEVRELLDPELPKNKRLVVTAAIPISSLKPEAQLAVARRVMEGTLHINSIRDEALARGETVNAVGRRKPSDLVEILVNNADSLRKRAEGLSLMVRDAPHEGLKKASSPKRDLFRGHLANAEEAVRNAVRNFDRVFKK